MQASTLVARTASNLHATWTGYVSEKEASVVFFWPDHKKVSVELTVKEKPDVRYMSGDKELFLQIKKDLLNA